MNVVVDSEFRQGDETRVVAEFKGSGTFGLIPQDIAEMANEEGGEMWRRVVEKALQDFGGQNTMSSAVYGSFTQLLDSMIVKGADVGVLHDLQTFVFAILRRTSSIPGSITAAAAPGGKQEESEGFQVHYIVKRCTDTKPTVQQTLAYLLKLSEQECSQWAKLRRNALLSTLEQCVFFFLIVSRVGCSELTIGSSSNACYMAVLHIEPAVMP